MQHKHTVYHLSYFYRPKTARQQGTNIRAILELLPTFKPDPGVHQDAREVVDLRDTVNSLVLRQYENGLMDAFVLRPSLDPALPSSDDSTFRPPSSEQLLGQWFIVHSSLPFWRNKRNIKISYSAVSSPARPIVQTNDTVVYQTLNSDKLNTVNGVNTVAQSEEHGAWDWRGSGWVKVVNNHWEVLGHDCRAGDDARRWIVIHTGKSFFAPAAIHVYSRDKEELPEETRKTLVTALAQSQDLKGLAEDLFRVQQE